MKKWKPIETFGHIVQKEKEISPEPITPPVLEESSPEPTVPPVLPDDEPTPTEPSDSDTDIIGFVVKAAICFVIISIIIDNIPEDGEFDLTDSIDSALGHISSSNAPDPPPMVPGRDFEYNLGSGYGRLEFRTYGTKLPPIQQQKIAERGPFMAREFQRLTDYGPPSNFYYEIYFYTDSNQFKQTVGLQKNDRTGGKCFCSKPVSPIHVTGDIELVAHEMVHAISYAAYGTTPLFLTEGLAHWFGYRYRKRTGTSSNFYLRAADIAKLAINVNQGKFPSMKAYLACGSYDDWVDLLGHKWAGYPIGAILTDWLLKEKPAWMLRAMAYCHEKRDTQAKRSRAFYDYTEEHWPGGFAGMDREIQDWILNCARKYGR